MTKGYATVVNSKGIHARPSAELAVAAKSFESKITLNYNNKTANPESVLQTIILEMFEGAEVEIIAEGEDEVAQCRPTDNAATQYPRCTAVTEEQPEQ